MKPVEQIETRLLGVMASWPLPIEPGCEQDLRELIHKAAEQALREGHAPDSPKIYEAEANLRKLLTEMTRQAGALGYTELHEDTLVKAKGVLCPLWPFCKKK